MLQTRFPGDSICRVLLYQVPPPARNEAILLSLIPLAILTSVRHVVLTVPMTVGWCIGRIERIFRGVTKPGSREVLAITVLEHPKENRIDVDTVVASKGTPQSVRCCHPRHWRL